MKLLPILIICAVSCSGCLMKRTTTDWKGQTQEKYVIKRPVKKIITNLEVE